MEATFNFYRIGVHSIVFPHCNFFNGSGVSPRSSNLNLPFKQQRAVFEREIIIPPEKIDKIMSSEIPDIESDPDLHRIILKTMVHRECGRHIWPIPQSMQNGKCSKSFPHPFRPATETSENGSVSTSES